MSKIKEEKKYEKERITLIEELKKNIHYNFSKKELINILNFKHKKKYTEEDLKIITENQINENNDSIRYEDIIFLRNDLDINLSILKARIVDFFIYFKKMNNISIFKVCIALFFVLFFINLELGILLCFIILFFLKIGDKSSDRIESDFITFAFIYSSIYFLLSNFENIINVEIIKNTLTNANIKLELIDNRIVLDYFNIVGLIIALFIYFLANYIRYSESKKYTVLLIKIIPFMLVFMFTILSILNKFAEDYSLLMILSILASKMVIYLSPIIMILCLYASFFGLIIRHLIDKKFNEVLYLTILIFTSIIFLFKYDTIINNYYETKKILNNQYCSNLPNEIKIIKESNHKFKILIDKKTIENIDNKVLNDNLDLKEAFNNQKENNRFIYYYCK